MSANLITGNLFKPIYAYQDADYQAGISGNVTSIMPVGSQMALSIEDANTIKADDGVLITKEGRRIQIDAGAIEEWSIPTGTQGATNYFIIGFHLYTDSNSAEVCETFVEKMENATDTIPEGTFREGSTEVYVSLGRVVQNGINLDSVTSLVQIARSLEEVKNAISQLNSDLVPLPPITVIGDGVKTYEAVLNEIYARIDKSKIRATSNLVIKASTSTSFLIVGAFTDSLISTQGSANNNAINYATLKASASTYFQTIIGNTQSTNEYSNVPLGTGESMTFNY